MSEPLLPRQNLKVDLESLAMALEDAGGLVSYYLDPETGEVDSVPEDIRDLVNVVYDDLEEAGEDIEYVAAVRFVEALARLDLPLWLRQAVKEAYQVESYLDRRYVLLENANSSEGYREMEEYIAMVQDDPG